MFGTLKRPKPGETEEEVLASQKEFLKSGNLPSAKLVRPNSHKKLQKNTKKEEHKGILHWVSCSLILRDYR